MKGRLSHGTGFARTLGALRSLGALPVLGVRPTLSALPALGVLVLAAGLLGGCGGGGSSSTTITTSLVPSSPAASTHASSSSADAVASVAGVPIAKSSYEHWLAVEKAGGTSTNDGHRALSFLITSQWVIGEAAARGISVSDAEVKQRFAQISKQSFPKAGSLQKFLAKAEETEGDLLARVKVELLESRITAQVTKGKSGAQAKSVLASFQKAFQEHWKIYTTCKPAYVMEDCSEYKGQTGKPRGHELLLPLLGLLPPLPHRVRPARAPARAVSCLPLAQARLPSRARRLKTMASFPSSTRATAPTSARHWNGRTCPPRQQRSC